MKKIILLLLAIAVAGTTFADHHLKNEQSGDHRYARQHHLLDAPDCKQIKDGVGRFLTSADDLFEDIKNKGEEKNRKWNKEKGGEASFFAELAANYSTVYQVWCKKRPVHR